MFAQIGIATTSETRSSTASARPRCWLAAPTARAASSHHPRPSHGKVPTLAAAMAHFLASRARTIAFVRHYEEDLRAKLTWHPVLKDCNCHEMLLSIGLHASATHGRSKKSRRSSRKPQKLVSLPQPVNRRSS